MNDKFDDTTIKKVIAPYVGLDVDGDLIIILGKKYFVDCITGEIKEVK